MRAQCSLSFEYANILQTQAIVPRLNYSNGLAEQIILGIKNKKNEIKKYNKLLLSTTEEDDPNQLKSKEKFNFVWKFYLIFKKDFILSQKLTIFQKSFLLWFLLSE